MAKLEFYEAFDIIAKTVNRICSNCPKESKCNITCEHLRHVVDKKIKEAEKKDG